MTDRYSERIPVDLISGRLRGGNSDLEEKLLNQWLTKEENRKTYEKVERLWSEVCKRTSDAQFDEEKAWNEVEAGIRESYWKETAGRLRRRLAVASGIAAALLAGLIACYAFMSGNGSKEDTSDSSQSVVASAGSKTKIQLPDGTKAVLYPSSEITYPGTFRKESRDIDLKGRAYFNVAHNPQRPFNINVGGLTVTAVGTTFDLDARTSQVTVSLSEGSVRLNAESTKDDVTMNAGQIATYDRASGEITVKDGDPERASLWTGDQLKFSDATLGTVCRDLSDWYDMNIMVPDSLKNEGSLTFTISSEPLDVVLSIISRTNLVNYRSEGSNTVIIY